MAFFECYRVFQWRKSISKNEETYGVLLCKFSIFNVFEKLWYREPLDFWDLGGVSFHFFCAWWYAENFSFNAHLIPTFTNILFLESRNCGNSSFLRNSKLSQLNYTILWGKRAQKFVGAQVRNDGTKPCKRYFVTIWIFHYLFNNTCFKSVEGFTWFQWMSE